MRFFLIGHMGSGKSTQGKRLAKKLDYPFFDMDDLFEERYRSSINDFFAQYGEEAFRQAERELMLSYVFPEDCIVATGGGFPCYGDNLKMLTIKGATIYLKMNKGALAQRLSISKKKRPILAGIEGKENLIVFLREVLSERERYYDQADLIIDAKGLNLDTLSQQIREHVSLSKR